MAPDLQNKIFMLKKSKNNKFLTGIPPWIFIGAVAVLFPIFAFMTVENINRYRENSIRLLLEKGSALIRSFEAGARTGMMDMQWSGMQLQRLLTETAQQPDIDYILVANTNGTILAHNNPANIGKNHGKELELKKNSLFENVRWRLVQGTDKNNIFEVFHLFSPSVTYTPEGCSQCRQKINSWLMSHVHHTSSNTVTSLIIFVGLDMSSVNEARKADIVHTVVMGLVLLFIGFAGILLLFLVQSNRAARMSLSRIKAFSDNLVENMPIGLFAIDNNKKIASVNQVAESILGFSPDEVVGEKAVEILPRELWKQIENLDSARGVVEKEIECPVNGGKVVPLEVSSTMLYDEKGAFLGYVMLFKDLSEVRFLRKQITRSQRLASIGSLAAGVAHEIRNPLSSIKGFATYFKQRYKDVSEDQNIADIMIQEVDRLNRVIGQLIEFSRPVSISGRSVQIGKLVEDSVKLIEMQAAEKKIDIQTYISPDVNKVFIDQDRINQVLLNLYLNALESMGHEGKLSIALSKDGEKGTEIRVSDTGAGIGKEDLIHIFDPYFTTKSSGTGLGLAIVHNIIEAHGGRIKVESVVGTGTDVIVFLPELGT
ncbi:MAG: PAS domain S-box protein [Desulfobacteraceae bacterium]|nr:PAS domain S-box protein [Desulfobacteraceae bacterium]